MKINAVDQNIVFKILNLRNIDSEPKLSIDKFFFLTLVRDQINYKYVFSSKIQKRTIQNQECNTE